MDRRASKNVRPLPLQDLGPDGGDIPFLVWLTARATGGRMDRAIAPSGLTAEEFAVYSILRGSDGITPTQLSRWLAAPLTTVSNFVRRFEGRGHVERAENPEDRRSFLIRLTPDGREAWQAAERLAAPVAERIAERLGPVERELRAALERLREVLDEPPAPAGEAGREKATG